MKRKSRNKLAKKNIDLSIPFDITVIGTENDPCFGKLHDTLSPECQRCGDSEFCAIATAQRLKEERLKLESKNTYKDIEEIKVVTYKELRIWLRKQLREDKKEISKLKSDAIEELSIGPFLFDKYIKRLIKKSKYFHLSKDKVSLIYTKWKKK